MNQIQMLKRQILSTTKKSRLPSNFQEVEYIGTQLHCGIQLSSSFPVSTAKMKVRYAAQQNPIQSTTVNQRILSYGFVGLKTNFSLWESWENQHYMFSTLGKETFMGTYDPLQEHTIVAERDSSTTAKYYIDGVLVQSITGTFAANAGSALVLFVSALSTESHQYYGKVKYFQLEHDDVPIYDLVPCYRKSDGEIGLYNLVDNHFFANDLSGSFLKGADV